ncbi:Expansin-YoaJ [Paramyrothecium foliicola]|nr:Expansin-YoaJ [Paramyrothecium foliicola]
MKFATVLLAASAVSAAPSFSAPALTGTSTHYGGNLQGGNCGFSTYTLPAGLYGTAYSGSAWDLASVCGACIEVTGPRGNKIKAMIVDKCSECSPGHLDLFMNAFGQLEDPGKGLVSTSHKFVPCGITSPIKLQNKSGTSAWWFSMQVVNANEPVASLEVSTDGGRTWQGTQRRDYNFFENPSGFRTERVDVRVRSITGKVITVRNVGVVSDSSVTAGGNFVSTKPFALDSMADSFTSQSSGDVDPTETKYTSTITITVEAVAPVTKRDVPVTFLVYDTPCFGAVRYSSAFSCISVSSEATVTAAASTTVVISNCGLGNSFRNDPRHDAN